MDVNTSPDRSRRADVRSFPIVLADGNEWGLAMPSPRIRPEVVEGHDALGRPARTIRLVPEFGYPLEIRRLVDDLRCACDRGGSDRQYAALIRLAAALICRAHDIDRPAAASLLDLTVDDLPRLVVAVLSVVAGESLADPAGPRKVGVDG